MAVRLQMPVHAARSPLSHRVHPQARQSWGPLFHTPTPDGVRHGLPTWMCGEREQTSRSTRRVCSVTALWCRRTCGCATIPC